MSALKKNLHRVGTATLFGGLTLAAVSLVGFGSASHANAGFSAGSDCPQFGTGTYFNLSADCPAGYVPADTSTAHAYAVGQTFSVSVVVHNRTNEAISVPTNWGYSHILTVKDSKDGKPPLNTVDVSDGFTPSGFLPVTEYNWFALGMFRGDTQAVVVEGPSFVLTVPANSSVTVTKSGSVSFCGFVQFDMASSTTGQTLSSGLIRVLGCETPTPTPTGTPEATATPTPSETPESTPTPSETPESTPTPSPSDLPSATPTTTATPTSSATPAGGVLAASSSPTPAGGAGAAISAPSTGAETPLAAGLGLTLVGGILLAFAGRRRPDSGA